MDKKNNQTKELTGTIEVKQQNLISRLSKIMDKTDEKYAPFLNEELQKRLEKVIVNFNNEVKILIEDSFKRWRAKDLQLREIISASNQIKLDKTKMKTDFDSKAPSFLKI